MLALACAVQTLICKVSSQIECAAAKGREFACLLFTSERSSLREGPCHASPAKARRSCSAMRLHSVLVAVVVAMGFQMRPLLRAMQQSFNHLAVQDSSSSLMTNVCVKQKSPARSSKQGSNNSVAFKPSRTSPLPAPGAQSAA